ncbi:Thioredoxin-like protein YusE [Paenibacillus nuruki]|jgi:thiol-disulfide isomerase/thioredoxin|uniref:Thioredoxin-like protein YusE n=2 Tax=Paenibacillus TaxID=44249 RepID=A0A1E3L8V1_9BACL|nr:thioredoxin family protein [Paenibacillus nuruki]ODP30064.1 Thioredoxin-like protein YusE [Paenibacillus nuruki]
MAMIEELTEQQALAMATTSGQAVAIYAYTPLCGTCKMGRRMLEITLPLLPEQTVYALNVNFAPTFVQAYEISSIPCLIVFEAWREKTPRFLYRMESVPRILEHIRSAIA